MSTVKIVSGQKTVVIKQESNTITLSAGTLALTDVDASVLGSGSATDGYVLTADGAGNSAWEAVPGGGGNEFNDDVFRIRDQADTTKKMAFQVSGVTTATTRTITVPDQDITLEDPSTHMLVNGTRAMTGNLDMGTNAITNVGNVDGRDVSADGTKLDGIESGATADQTAGEIEAIVNHDNLLGFVANEHLDWTQDQGATNIHINNLDPDFTDNIFRISDNLDSSKKLAFQVSGLTTATTRTITIPDQDLTLEDPTNKLLLNGTRAMTGNLDMGSNAIVSVGNVDGRDVSADGTKLDGIEALADVTDATNVAAAGAVMDGDFSTNGVMIRTAAGTYTNRTITGTANEVVLADGDGVSGNPVVGIADNAILPGTSNFVPPSGTTAQRPAGSAGQTRYNSSDNKLEYHNGTGWVQLDAAGGGDVTGPASSTDNALVTFNGTSGKAIDEQATALIYDGTNLSRIGGLNINSTVAVTGDITLTGDFDGISTNGLMTRTAAGTHTTRSVAGTTNEIDVSNGDGASGNPTVGISDNPTIPGTGAILVPVGTTAQRPAHSAGKVRWNTTDATLEVSNGSSWEDLLAGGNVFADDVFRIQDNADATKEIAFQASGITTATTRTITMPDKDVTLDDSSDSRTPTAHAASHVRGGSDEIDGDTLDIDWNPSNYTPSTAPTEVTNVDELTAHLAGIDDRVALATTTVRGTVELATDGENAANVVVQGNDSRLSDARTPTAHASSHSDGGSDEITVQNLGSGAATAGQVLTADGAGGLNIGAPDFGDDIFRVSDNADGTKKVALQLSGITTATTRTLTPLNKDYTLGDVQHTDFSANGMLARTASETYASRTITGTASEIDVANGDGVSANPTIGISDNATLPGTGNFVPPSGTTAQRPAAGAGKTRYNTSDNKLEYHNGTGWIQLDAAGGGDVTGPGSSTDNALVTWNGTSGTSIDEQATPILYDGTNLSRTGGLNISSTVAVTGDITLTGDFDGISANGLMTRTAAGTHTTRSVAGTTNEIDVSNGDGASGNPTVGISDNPTIPGTGAILVPVGTTAQRPAHSAGKTRWNTTIGTLEVSNGAAWQDALASGDTTFADDVFRVQDNADATKELAFQCSGITTATTRTLTPLNKDYTIGDIQHTDFGSNGMLARTASETYASRTITGTASEVDITNGDGVSGNPTIGIADNPTIPGTGAILVPVGTDAQRPAHSAGKVRWNTTGATLEVSNGSSWEDALASGSTTFADDVFRIQDNADATKEIAFQASGITTGTVRTLTPLNKDYTLGDVQHTDFGSNGILARTASETYASRTVTGTASEIDIANGDGVSGNPTIGIADNPTIPGTGAILVPVGTTAQRPSHSAGKVRWNTTDATLEVSNGSSWEDLLAGGNTFLDTVFRIQDDGDNTKQIAFQASGITTATTRTLTPLNKDYTLGDVQHTDFSANGMLARTASETYAARTVTGTASEIDVSNGDGVSGNPTIGISDDAVLPGTGSVTVPVGTTAQRPGNAAGRLRWNTTTTRLEVNSGTGWVNADLSDAIVDGDYSANGLQTRTASGTYTSRTVTGTANEIDVADGDGVSGNPTIGLSDNPTVPGTGAILVPSGTTAQRPAHTAGKLRWNSTIPTLEVSDGDSWEDCLAGGTTFADNVFRVQDDGDNTKQIAFQASGITTATTRTITMPDKDVTLDDSGDARTPTAHASTHVRGGADEIDGDTLSIDWNPSNYTPSIAPTEVTNADELTAHLAGIDKRVAQATTLAIGTVELAADGENAANVVVQGNDSRLSDSRTPTAHASTHVRGGSDEVDGDVLDIDFTPSNYTPSTAPAEVTNVDELSAHLAGIDDRVAQATTSVRGTVELATDGENAANVVVQGNDSRVTTAILDGDFSAGEGFMRKTGAGAYEAIKSNLNASANPGATDDSSAGYAVGSVWINTTGDTVYQCVDSTASSAVWKDLSAGAAGGETNTASNVGTGGVGVFKVKSGVDLQFKKINSVANETSVFDDTGNDEVDIGIADNPTIPGTGAILVPVGTTAQRPSHSAGKLRWNTTDATLEVSDGSAWQDALGGGSGTIYTMQAETFGYRNDSNMNITNVGAMGTTGSVIVTAFDDTTEEAVDFTLYFPANTTQFVIRYLVRSSGATGNVDWRLSYALNGSGTWNTHNLTHNSETSVWAERSETVLYTDPTTNFVADNFYNIQFSRHVGGTDALSGDAWLAAISLEFS